MSVHLYLALRVVFLPAGAAALALVAARLVSGRNGTAARIVATGAAAGAIVADVGLAGLPPLPPVDTIGWIPFATAAALLLVLLVPRAADLVALLAVSAAAAFLVGRPAWGGSGAVGIGITALATALLAGGLGWAADRQSPTWVLIGFAVAAVGASLACLASHSALLALILGGIAATATTLAVGGRILRVPLGGRALAGALVVPAACLALYAHLYSALPVGALVLLGAAALAPALAAALPRFRARALVGVGLAAALAVCAFVSARQPEVADPDDVYYK